MSTTKTIKTREFLRNFKELKELLTSGRIQHLLIDIGDHRELDISLRQQTSTGKNIAKTFGSMLKPIHIRRTRLFDEILP